MDGLIAMLRWEVPLHLLMAGAMVPAMVWPSAALSVASAALLVVVSIACARYSRRSPFLREHIVDLWAMALLLILLAPSAPVSGHGHGVRIDAGFALAAVVAGWVVARVLLMRRMPASERLRPALSSGLTAVGIGIMLGVCG